MAATGVVVVVVVVGIKGSFAMTGTGRKIFKRKRDREIEIQEKKPALRGDAKNQVEYTLPLATLPHRLQLVMLGSMATATHHRYLDQSSLPWHHHQ